MQELGFWIFIAGGVFILIYAFDTYRKDKKKGGINITELLMLIVPAIIMFGGALAQWGVMK